MSNQNRRRATKQDAKNQFTKLIELVPGSGVVYEMRRTEISTLFIEGALPAPLLKAVDALQNMRRDIQKTVDPVVPTTPETATDQLQKLIEGIRRDDLAQHEDIMRRVAVAISVSPKFVFDKDEADRSDSLIWVNELPFEALMTIWRFAMGEAGISVLSTEEAESFRSGKSPVHAEAVPHGADVRTEAVSVDPEEHIRRNSMEKYPTAGKPVAFVSH